MSIIHAMNPFKSKINKIIAGIFYTTGRQLLKLRCYVMSLTKKYFVTVKSFIYDNDKL